MHHNHELLEIICSGGEFREERRVDYVELCIVEAELVVQDIFC